MTTEHYQHSCSANFQWADRGCI